MSHFDLNLTLTRILPVATAALTASFAVAMPPMGGPMNHVEVGFFDGAIDLHVGDPTPMVLQYSDDTYEGAAAVLNGMAFNAQYGWMPSGFWQPPEGTLVWIDQIDATPGLKSYRGMTFAPIFGTDGSASGISWNGTMLHNWYAAAVPGEYQATYEVYIGDVDGSPVEGYVSDQITLAWTLPGVLGDIDSDSVIDGADLGVLLSAWGTGDPHADLDGSGTVDGADLGMLLAAWTA